MLLLPPQPNMFPRDFPARCSRAAQQMNTVLLWTLSCITQPVLQGSSLPSSRVNPLLGCKCMVQGGLQQPASAGKGMPPTSLQHGHFQKSFQGFTNTTKSSGLKSNWQHCQVICELIKKASSCAEQKQTISTEREFSSTLVLLIDIGMRWQSRRLNIIQEDIGNFRAQSQNSVMIFHEICCKILPLGPAMRFVLQTASGPFEEMMN